MAGLFTSRALRGALAMAVGSIAALGLHAAAEAAAAAPLVLAQTAIALMPGGAATALIGLLEAWAMRAAIALAYVAFLAAGALAGPFPRARVAFLALPWAIGPLGVLTVPAANGDVLASAVAALASAAVALATAELLGSGVSHSPGRRRLLAAGAAAFVVLSATALRALTIAAEGLGAGAALALRRAPRAAAPPQPANDPPLVSAARLDPDVTRNADFYVVDEAIVDPLLDPRSWRLAIDGHVQLALSIGYDELLELDGVEQYETLECISNSVGWPLIGNALWVGVPVRTLLDRARVRDGTAKMIFTSVDGYSSALPLDVATDQRTLVAYGMNGRALPREHGFPARLLIPGRYGMKHVKWLARVTATREDYQGFWERRGWSDESEVFTMSRIDAPQAHETLTSGRATTIGGVAYAGARGISKVELSTDGGRTWREADLGRRFSNITWRRWALEWSPPAPGFHRLVVRAYDDGGALQTANGQDPLPSGATGLHTFQVEVR